MTVGNNAQSSTRRIKPLKYPLDPEVCSKAARYAIRVSEEMSKRSTLLQNPMANVPTLEREDIMPLIGDLLGKGGFNSVYELEKNPEQLDRSKKLAVKFLSDDAMFSKEDFCNGAADLFMEANYLAALAQHPHPALIRLHGVCGTGPTGFGSPQRAGFFIIIDRLYDTLDRRIEVWRELERRKVSTQAAPKVLKALYLQRLMVAQDIASALRHLHKVSIIFRDLKPDNVGFDFDGRVKLFDFGLAKELDPKQLKDSGLYAMSGVTGSRRFMSPEVAVGENYNLSADMYSFSILFWELLTLEKAFGRMSPDEHRDRVIRGGERPPIRENEWGQTVVSILESCWSRQPLVRPSARDVYKLIQADIQRIYREDFQR